MAARARTSYFEIEGSDYPPIAMTRVATADPYVVDLFARYPETCKPWVKAGLSSHMWVGSIPADLASRPQGLIARAVDEYGQEHEVRFSTQI